METARLRTRALEKPEWANDQNLRSDSYRIEHYDEVESLINAVTKEKLTEDWLRIFLDNQVAAGPINTVEDLFRDPQVLASNLVVTMQHPKAGEIKLLAPPFKLSETPASVAMPPPMLGQHVQDVFEKMGFSESEISTLFDSGAISC